MKKVMIMVAVMALASASAWAGCGSCPGDKPAAKGEACPAGKAACCKAGDTVYVCAACKTCDAKAGKCAKCSAEMKAMHVLAMKDGAVSLCPCEAGCKCTVKADDATQCSCGKAVVTLQCAQACKTDKAAEAPKAEKK